MGDKNTVFHKLGWNLFINEAEKVCKDLEAQARMQGNFEFRLACPVLVTMEALLRLGVNGNDQSDDDMDEALTLVKRMMYLPPKALVGAE